jgi:hypothetical protein
MSLAFEPCLLGFDATPSAHRLGTALRRSGRGTSVAAALAASLTVVGCIGETGAAIPVDSASASAVVLPASVSIEECGIATFSVELSGSTPVGYQWLRDGDPILGASGSSLVVSRAGMADDGTEYAVIVTTAVGPVKSSGAVLHVSQSSGVSVFAPGRAVRLTMGSGRVYYTDGVDVLSASAECGTPVETIYRRAAAVENTYAIALAGDRVVWVDRAGGAIRTVRTDGSDLSTVASELGINALSDFAVAGDEVYWPNLVAGVQSATLVGGALATYDSGALPFSTGGIAVDDAFVYWTDLRARALKRMPRGGGAVITLASDQEYPGSVVADGTAVYWTNAVGWETPNPTGYIMKVDRDGGAPVVLAAQPTLTLQLALQRGVLYWTSGNLFESVDAAGGSLSKMPVDGSSPPMVLQAQLEKPFGIAIDDQYVYWVDVRGIVRVRM